MITVGLNLQRAGKGVIPVLATAGRVLDVKRLAEPGSEPFTRHPHEKAGSIRFSNTPPKSSSYYQQSGQEQKEAHHGYWTSQLGPFFKFAEGIRDMAVALTEGGKADRAERHHGSRYDDEG